MDSLIPSQLSPTTCSQAPRNAEVSTNGCRGPASLPRACFFSDKALPRESEGFHRVAPRALTHPSCRTTRVLAIENTGHPGVR